MEPERAQNITSPIETHNVHERNILLDGKINLISLHYADRKYQEIKREEPNYKFHEALKDYTEIPWNIVKGLRRLEGFDLNDHKKSLDLFLASFFEKIDLLYEEVGFDLDRILELVEVAKGSVAQYLGVENYKKIEIKDGPEEKGENGLVYFENIDSIGGSDDGRWSGLKKVGFSKYSKLTEIHVRDFYKTGRDRAGLELIKKDLERVAVSIIDKAPDTAAVVGASWLMSTPIAKALGFIKIPGEDDSDEERLRRGEKRKRENDPSTWSQFVGKDGQINQKRFDEFQATGKIPFKSVKAYIPVEDFLRRYLPTERRGEVVLKVLREDHEDIEAENNAIANTLKQDWDELLGDPVWGAKSFGAEGSDDDFLQSFIANPNTQKFLSLLEADDREVVISFFGEMYSKKIPVKEFNQYRVGKFEMMKGLGMKMSNRKYIEKKVMID
jgi:hypothetical protein